MFNVGPDAMNSVPHLHLHVLGGEPLQRTLRHHMTTLMTTTLRAECFVPGNHLMAGLLGTRDEHLRQIEQAFPDEQIVVQGNRISVEGPQAEVVVRLFDELILMVQSGTDLDSSTLAAHDRHGARGHPARARCCAPRWCGPPAARRCVPTRPGRSATSTPSRRTSSPSASARPGPASRTWPWPRPCTPCSPAR